MRRWLQQPAQTKADSSNNVPGVLGASPSLGTNNCAAVLLMDKHVSNVCTHFQSRTLYPCDQLISSSMIFDQLDKQFFLI